FPGVSCKDIWINTKAQKNGEYWIDPKGTGIPFKVYCDMTTDRDHTLLGQVMETVNVTNEFECHRKCIGNSTCKSFNVHPPKSNPMKNLKTCETNDQTRQTKPKQYKKKIGSSYYGSVEVSCVNIMETNSQQKLGRCHPEYSGEQCTVKKGSSPDFPGVSCKDIRKSSNAQKNGEYWIDPKGTGHLFKVYCDMTTDGDHALLGHVMETVNVTDEFECHRKCIQNNTCKSFNIHPLKTNAVQKTCEMNNQTRQLKPKHYKKKIGSSYHGSVETFLVYLFCLFVDHTLLGQVIQTVNVTDEFQCHRKCIGNSTCKSFNVHPAKINPMKNLKTCETKYQTRQTKPKQYKKKIGSSYHGSVELCLLAVKKGSSPDFPGVSCKDIRKSSNAQKNGEYWIDPKGTGHLFKVYCDMTTDGAKREVETGHTV
ncbi:hypothetical protein P5673_009155, partial [Acropora cervicornis]